MTGQDIQRTLDAARLDQFTADPVPSDAPQRVRVVQALRDGATIEVAAWSVGMSGTAVSTAIAAAELALQGSNELTPLELWGRECMMAHAEFRLSVVKAMIRDSRTPRYVLAYLAGETERGGWSAKSAPGSDAKRAQLRMDRLVAESEGAA